MLARARQLVTNRATIAAGMEAGGVATTSHLGGDLRERYYEGNDGAIPVPAGCSQPRSNRNVTTHQRVAQRVEHERP